jgi:ADP-ribosylglycohydrolase
MSLRSDKNRGVLLGLASGDALGRVVDPRNLEEIRNDYGPNGLLGYDLVNGYADITSYTQLAAFTANGLILGLTRGQAQGRPSILMRYVTSAIREWNRTQTFSMPAKNYCWVTGVPQLRRKFCMDNRMLDALSKENLGTLEEPLYRSKQPGSLTAVIPLAMLRRDLELTVEELDRLAAEIVSLTHGEPEAYLAGAALNHILCLLLEDPQQPMEVVVRKTIDSVGLQFMQGGQLWELLQFALTQASLPTIKGMNAMENLGCSNASEVLAGAVYAVAACGDDFDTALITAVNHSGRSSAVGALTGAMLGAKLGFSALPDFYLEGLEAAPALTELADDMACGFSEMVGKSLFDMDWDKKYLSVGK